MGGIAVEGGRRGGPQAVDRARGHGQHRRQSSQRVSGDRSSNTDGDGDPGVDSGGRDATADATADVADATAPDATSDTAADGAPEDTPPEDAPPEDTAPEDTSPPDTTPPDVAEDTGSAGRWQSGDPSAAGPYGFATFTETLTTSVQDVEVSILVPDDADDAPYPVVVFNHGFQMTGAMYVGYGERLASHGFVVILPTIGDPFLSARTHLELATIQTEIDSWIADAASAPGSRVFGVADASLLGVGGHSRGGKASLLAAADDDRIRASFNVDPVDSAPPSFGTDPADFPSVTPERMGDLGIPTGYVGAGLGGTAVFGLPCAPVEDNYHAYFEHSPSPSFEYELPDAGHNDFIEDCNFVCMTACTAGDDRELAQQVARTTMVAFYKVFLAEDASYRPWVDGEEARAWTGISFNAR